MYVMYMPRSLSVTGEVQVQTLTVDLLKIINFQLTSLSTGTTGAKKMELALKKYIRLYVV